MNRSVISLGLTSIIFVALQLDIVSPLRVGGVVIMVIWLWPVAVGLTATRLEALFSGAFTGLLFDAHAATPLGLTGAIGVILGLIASRLGQEGIGDLDSAAWWVMPSLAAGAGFSAPLFFALGGTLYGNLHFWRANLGVMMIVNAVAFFVLVRPLARLARRVSSNALSSLR